MHSLGRWGEQRAAEFLRASGYRILDRNWRWGRLEIDLVALREGVVAFVEVKTRTPGTQRASEAVDRRKRFHVRRAAAAWISDRHVPADEYRFDVIAVDLDGSGGYVVRHLEQAFTGDDT